MRKLVTSCVTHGVHAICLFPHFNSFHMYQEEIHLSLNYRLPIRYILVKPHEEMGGIRASRCFPGFKCRFIDKWHIKYSYNNKLDIWTLCYGKKKEISVLWRKAPLLTENKKSESDNMRRHKNFPLHNHREN